MKKSFCVMFTLIFACLLAGVREIRAQNDNDDQTWNDAQLTVPMSKRFDFFLQGTLRFGQDWSRLNERRIQVGYTFKSNKSLGISTYYWSITARNTKGIFVQENRLNLRAVYHFPFKKIGVSHRSIYEYRMKPPANTWRYRPSLTFDKDIKKIIPGAKYFVGDEIFYDSGTKKFSRNRFSTGISETFNQKYSLDVYYMRQNDGYAHPGDLNVLWTTFKIKW